MATSKTLAPTNVTISIPAMTDAPNASVLANCADKEADAINALNSQLASTSGGVPKRQAGVIAAGGSATISLSSDYSANTEYALVALNYSGNALGGSALVFLGRGTGKYKDLIGSMESANYTLAYSGNVWTITNNSSNSQLFYTALISK